MRIPFPHRLVATRAAKTAALFAALAMGSTFGVADAFAQREDAGTSREGAQEREQGNRERDARETPSESGARQRNSEERRRDEARPELGIILAPSSEGVRVARVRPGGPADEAGLKRGDIIISVDDTKLTSPRAAIEHLAEHRPGDKCRVVFQRDGEEQTVEVTLGRSQRPSFPPPPFEARARETAWLGALLFDASGDGATVAVVFPTGPAKEAGLQPGDTIVGVNDDSIESPEDLESFLQDAEPEEQIKLSIHRDGEEQTLDVTLGRHVVVDLAPRGPGDRRGDRARSEREDDAERSRDRMPRRFRGRMHHEGMWMPPHLMQRQLREQMREMQEQLDDLQSELRRLRNEGAEGGRERSRQQGTERQRTEI